jgi:protease-4
MGDVLQPPQPPRQGPPQGPGGPALAQVVYAQPPGGHRRSRGRFWGAFVIAFVLVLGFALVLMSVFGIGRLLLGPTGTYAVEYRPGDASQTIAIVPLVGTVDSEMAAFAREACRDLADDPDIRAVILHVDSPGGYVTPSDQIAREVRRLQDDGMTVFASYESVAASGGYYASVLADKIFAEPTTITGSIGVIGQAMVFEGLMEKIGVEPMVFVAEGSPKKRLANQTYEAWGDEDREQYQIILDAYYDRFLEIVREGRAEHFESDDGLREVCNGLAYTAQTALDLKLIDAIGDIDDAIDDLAMRLNLPVGTSPRVVRYVRPASFELPFIGRRQSSTESNEDDAVSRLLEMGSDPDRVRLYLHELGRPRAMYIMP